MPPTPARRPGSPAVRAPAQRRRSRPAGLAPGLALSARNHELVQATVVLLRTVLRATAIGHVEMPAGPVGRRGHHHTGGLDRHGEHDLPEELSGVGRPTAKSGTSGTRLLTMNRCFVGASNQTSSVSENPNRAVPKLRTRSSGVSKRRSRPRPITYTRQLEASVTIETLAIPSPREPFGIARAEAARVQEDPAGVVVRPQDAVPPRPYRVDSLGIVVHHVQDVLASVPCHVLGFPRDAREPARRDETTGTSADVEVPSLHTTLSSTSASEISRRPVRSSNERPVGSGLGARQRDSRVTRTTSAVAAVATLDADRIRPTTSPPHTIARLPLNIAPHSPVPCAATLQPGSVGAVIQLR